MMQLNNVYQRDDFIRFLEEDLLTDFKRDIRPVNTSSLTCISKAQYLGESKDLDLQVFEFIFEGSANKRVTLTKDAFSVMRSSAIYNALAVFHTEDNKDWRFSLLTATPEPTEKGKVSLTYSNPKRLSFFLGPNAKVNTPTKFLISKGKIVDFDDLKSRFSIEVVNKEFYKEISQAFTELVSGQLKLPSTQDKSQTNLKFAVRLIGRIIFCWFLREKKSDAGLSLMPKELLSIEAVQDNKDFYHSILEPIFFEVLNKPVKSRRDDFAKEPFSSVPYLNGGLFSPQEDDFYKRLNGDFQSQFHNTLIIPDTWLNSFFEILETYNFTIDENTSYDEELSIDPEMLGRIFENLLAEINPETGESARKKTGSYYTPRAIVNYMVDESLLLYLKEQTGIKEEKLRAIISYDLSDDSDNPVNTNEKEKIIEALGKVKILDPACGSGAFPIGALQKIVFILQQVDPNGQMWFKKQITNASPEFRRDIEKKFSNNELDFIRKLGVIRKSIYGVDIQPIATEISRLRCFLTLIVDEVIIDKEGNRGIKPLPNLDFKFVTANSLIGLPRIDDNPQQFLFDERSNIQKLRGLMDDFFSADEHDKYMLMNEFHHVQKDLIKQYFSQKDYASSEQKRILADLGDWDPFSRKQSTWFDPEWMFGIKDGFNIVIANPPYIGEKGHKDLFRTIRLGTLKPFYERKMDLFYFFFHLGLSISTDKGIVSFITTNYYLTASGAKKLRTRIATECSIIRLCNFNEYKIFESAKGQHNILTLLQKGKLGIKANNFITHNTGVATADDLTILLGGVDGNTDYFSVSQNELYDGPEFYIRLNGKSSNSDDKLLSLLDKISSGTPLGNILNINMGVQSGADEVGEKLLERAVDSGFVDNSYLTKNQIRVGTPIYVVDKEFVDQLTPHERTTIRPFIKNSDIKKYYVPTTYEKFYLYLDSAVDVEKFPIIKKHLLRFRPILKAREQVNDKDDSWYWIRGSKRKYLVNTGEHIICPYRTKSNIFSLTDGSIVGAGDVYFITRKESGVSLKYILAILNSKLCYLWLYYRGKRKGETLELYQKPLSEVPIKKIPLEKQKPYIEVVDKILSITRLNGYLENKEGQAQVQEYEKQIDKLVYKLFDLSPEEINTVENFADTKRYVN